MAEPQGVLMGRRRWSTLGWHGENLDWSLALAAVAIGIAGYLIGDRTNWTGGLGYDGRLYGELAKNFPSVVFGHGHVIPPGIGRYDGPPLTGLDAYYAFRIVPSGLVWLILKAGGAEATTSNVIAGFALLNAAMFGLATFCWCRIAGLLRLGDGAKLLGAIALIVNFAVLKGGSYYPVITDETAMGLGTLCLYLWLRRQTLWLALCVAITSLTWPAQLLVGGLLLLFPAPAGLAEGLRLKSDRDEPRSWRPPPFGAAVGAIAALGVLTWLVVLELQGYTQFFGTDRLPVFPVSVAITALYVFVVVALLLPKGGVRELVEIVLSIRLRNLLLAILTVILVLAAGSLVARRESASTFVLTKDALWTTTLDPGLFLVVLVGYFGPLLLFVYADLPRVAADAWRFGPAIVVALGVALLGALLAQPRVISNVFPVLVLFGVLAARRIYPPSPVGIAVFAGASLALSRVWLHLGDLGPLTRTATLQEFPLQRYYMATGTWTAPSMYAAQLGALLLIALMFAWVVRRQQ